MKTLGAVGLAVALGLGLSQGSSWKTLAPLSEARQEIGVAAAGGRIYVAGGFYANAATSDLFEAYDPVGNRWQRLEPLPIAVNHPGMAALDGKLYVLGGYRGPGLGRPTAAVQVYDPVSGRWSQKSPMPTARGGLIAVELGGRLYAVGGAAGASVGDFAVYDPATDRWSELPPMPTPRDHLAAGVIGGKIYVVGGRNQQSFTLKALEAYDPASGRWSSLPPMPTGRSGHAAAAVGSCLYVFGGEGNRNARSGVFAEVEAYNAATNIWKSLEPMPAPRHGIMAAVLSGRIYLPGGADVQGLGAVTTSDVFDPPGC